MISDDYKPYCPYVKSQLDIGLKREHVVHTPLRKPDLVVPEVSDYIPLIYWEEESIMCFASEENKEGVSHIVRQATGETMTVKDYVFFIYNDVKNPRHEHIRKYIDQRLLQQLEVDLDL